ncbi:Oidioi.mRNA.OKI2018_I69.chr2.g4020.t1.cds [Oikopleura dioica]|uniref:Oidioi.mRNA.OKI2018_I69.chr2.g4020.t1.cds n=1 Tax=Oikopleura dioica TaxID=34765 RepID=A0ABN7T2Q1_OIKDI|nr:Oidioi.mRNA.OKI2018_I69.chr2.g4020.t1.cds [Oikopleura dioica]
MQKTKILFSILLLFEAANGNDLPSNFRFQSDKMKQYFKDVYQRGNFKKHFTNPMLKANIDQPDLQKIALLRKKFTKPTTNNVLGRMAKVGKLSALQKDPTLHNFLEERQKQLRLAKAANCLLVKSSFCKQKMYQFVHPV